MIFNINFIFIFLNYKAGFDQNDVTNKNGGFNRRKNMRYVI